MSSDETPRQDAGTADLDSDRQPQIVVDDPEDFARTRQLRAIFDAADDYIETRRNANRAHEDGDIGFPERDRRIFRYLQDLAMRMEPLLKQYDAGQEIWNEREYAVDNKRLVAKGGIPDFDDAVRYCESIVQNADQIDHDAADLREATRLLDQLPSDDDDTRSHASGGRRRPPGQIGGRVSTRIKNEFRQFATDWGWRVTGLESLVDGTPTLEFCDPRRHPYVHTTVPPQDVADAAFRDLQDFLREVGLGIQFDETQQTKIDDELLDEVDTWRQKNVN